jgi:hypothetical protein
MQNGSYLQVGVVDPFTLFCIKNIISLGFFRGIRGEEGKIDLA